MKDHLLVINDSYYNKARPTWPILRKWASWDNNLPDHLLPPVTTRTYLWLGLFNNYAYISPIPSSSSCLNLKQMSVGEDDLKYCLLSSYTHTPPPAHPVGHVTNSFAFSVLHHYPSLVFGMLWWVAGPYLWNPRILILGAIISSEYWIGDLEEGTKYTIQVLAICGWRGKKMVACSFWNYFYYRDLFLIFPLQSALSFYYLWWGREMNKHLESRI
jgi:hypothetical protein